MRSFILCACMICGAGSATAADALARHLLVTGNPDISEAQQEEIAQTLQRCKDGFIRRLNDLEQFEVSQRHDSSEAVAALTSGEWSGTLIAAASIEACAHVAGLPGVHLIPQSEEVTSPLLE